MVRVREAEWLVKALLGAKCRFVLGGGSWVERCAGTG